MTQQEPEWSQEDRDWLVALAVVEADTCRGCGQPLSETTSPERDVVIGRAGRYVQDPPVTCSGCVALDAGRKPYDKHAHRAYLHFPPPRWVPAPPRPVKE